MKLLSFEGGPTTAVKYVLLPDSPGPVRGNRGKICIIALTEISPFVNVKKDGRVVAHFLYNLFQGNNPLPEFLHQGRQDVLHQWPSGRAF